MWLESLPYAADRPHVLHRFVNSSFTRLQQWHGQAAAGPSQPYSDLGVVIPCVSFRRWLVSPGPPDATMLALSGANNGFREPGSAIDVFEVWPPVDANPTLAGARKVRSQAHNHTPTSSQANEQTKSQAHKLTYKLTSSKAYSPPSSHAHDSNKITSLNAYELARSRAHELTSSHKRRTHRTAFS